MPRTLGTVAAVALALAVPAHAAEPAGDQADGPPRAAADSLSRPPAVVTIPRKTQASWLRALARKADGARSALKGHTLVVTSGDSRVTTITYDDLEKSLGNAAPAVEEPPAQIDVLLAAGATNGGDP